MPAARSGGAPSAVMNPQIELNSTWLASRQPEPSHVWTIHARSFLPFSRIGGGMKWTKMAASAGASGSGSGGFAAVTTAGTGASATEAASHSDAAAASAPSAMVCSPSSRCSASAAAFEAPPYTSHALTSSGISMRCGGGGGVDERPKSGGGADDALGCSAAVTRRWLLRSL